jgi:hypothetical protein
MDTIEHLTQDTFEAAVKRPSADATASQEAA